MSKIPARKMVTSLTGQSQNKHHSLEFLISFQLAAFRKMVRERNMETCTFPYSWENIAKCTTMTKRMNSNSHSGRQNKILHCMYMNFVFLFSKQTNMTNCEESPIRGHKKWLYYSSEFPPTTLCQCKYSFSIWENQQDRYHKINVWMVRSNQQKNHLDPSCSNISLSITTL